MYALQLQRGLDALYAEPDLRSELTDSEAEVLLSWAAVEVEKLAALGLDDAAFNEALDQLKAVTRRINRYAGGGALSPDERERLRAELAQDAERLRFTDALSGVIRAQAANEPVIPTSGDPLTLVQALTALFTPPPPLPPDLPEWPDSHD